MNAARLRSLHGTLATLLLPLLAGLATVGGALVWEQWDTRRSAVDARLNDSAQSLGLLLERELAIETAVLEALSNSPLVDRQDWAALHALATRIVAKRPGALIAVTDASGQLILNTSVAFGGPLVNVHEMERERRTVEWRGHLLPVSTGGLTRRARETGKPSYSDLYFGVSTSEPSLAVAFPVERGGRFTHTLTYAYSARSIADFIAARNNFPGALAQVVDREGRVAASSRAHDELLARPMPLTLIAAANASIVETRHLDDRPRLIARASAGPSGWKVILSVPTQQAYASAYRSLAASVAFLAVAMALAALLVFRYSRRLSGPLLQLASRVRAEDSALPLPQTDIREIASLCDAVRTAELARERERDEQVRRKLAEEREVHARELAVELRCADRRKNDFLAMLAHELRNPLAPLLNSVHLLGRPETDVDRNLPKIRAIMTRQLQHLASLVEDLLDVTRIAQGKIVLRVRSVELGELLRRIVDDYESLLRGSRIDLRLQLPAEPIYLDVDPTRFTQMVANLVQNAAKFTPEEGTIRLSLSRSREGVRIAVRDSGQGLDAAKLEHLFEPFVQGSQEGARADGGLGLGLAIVKGLAELHGGTVAAWSDGPMKGAEFVIELPATGAGAQVAA